MNGTKQSRRPSASTRLVPPMATESKHGARRTPPTPPPIQSEPPVQARRKQDREVKAEMRAATAPENGFGSDAQRRSDELWHRPPRARVDGGGSSKVWVGEEERTEEGSTGPPTRDGPGPSEQGPGRWALTVGRPRRVRLDGPGSVGLP